MHLEHSIYSGQSRHKTMVPKPQVNNKGFLMIGNDETAYDWYGPDAATFGDRIAGARDVAGMSQSDLARRLGVRLSTLHAWEEDRSEPRANRLQMLSGLLNVSLPWLLNGTGDGLGEPDPDPMPKDINEILLEMRALKTTMAATADKLAHLEKRLRRTIRDEP